MSISEAGQNKAITYASTGVNYDAMDPLKRAAQLAASTTSNNLLRHNMQVIELSRGESAFVWEETDCYRAFVVEGLGTKNLIADKLTTAQKTSSLKGRSFYDAIAQDSVAMIVNDLIVVGADPQVVNAYFAVGGSEWFEEHQRMEDLVNGWAKACNLAGAVYGGGETPTLTGIINPETIDLAGAAIGIIKPKGRLTLGDKLRPHDRILLAPSAGHHSNGSSLIRAIEGKLPDGYNTILSDGTSFGEAALAPTTIYAPLVKELFDAGVDIHYMVHITGHGWRKLMRAPQSFSYVIDQIPKPHPIFGLIQKQAAVDDEEMYGNFNMGAGFAFFVPEEDVEKAQKVALEKQDMILLNGGFVQEGPKQVIIPDKNLVFSEKTLGVR